MKRAAAVLLLAVAACGSADHAGADPATVRAEQFAGGTCLVIAEDVIALRSLAVLTLQADPEEGALALSDVSYPPQALARLQPAVPRAGRTLRAPLEELVAATDGVARAMAGQGIAAENRLREAAEAVIAVCT